MASGEIAAAATLVGVLIAALSSNNAQVQIIGVALVASLGVAWWSEARYSNIHKGMKHFSNRIKEAENKIEQLKQKDGHKK